ncbi:hypothetical protein [Rhodoblastus sp.]|uniref:hypothetical protein n=1 Tax=Rhodoblastus sp. TaxID=1962975 RepID=UPI003F9D247D
MSVSQAFPPLGVEFEPFLYAIVCDDGNGTPLTIISAIARTGADPWTEAARIAKLPKTAALDVLARMVPERGAADGVAIANRLFALLPVARANRNIPFVGAKANAPKANAPKSNAPKSNALKSNAPGWSPLVPAILVLLLGLALVSAFRTTPHRDAGPHEMLSSAPVADKADP